MCILSVESLLQFGKTKDARAFSPKGDSIGRQQGKQCVCLFAYSAVRRPEMMLINSTTSASTSNM